MFILLLVFPIITLHDIIGYLKSKKPYYHYIITIAYMLIFFTVGYKLGTTSNYEYNRSKVIQTMQDISERQKKISFTAW